MKSKIPLPARIIGNIIGILVISGMVYWHTHLWHHASAAKMHFWPHCMVLATPLWILLQVTDKTSVTARLMQLAFVSSLIAQTIVWLGVITKPIF